MVRELLVCTAMFLIATTPVDAEDPSTGGVQFAADFAKAAGATLTTINGNAPQRSGELHGDYAADATVPPGQPGPLVLRVTEDETINGPDGEPGVLRLDYVAVPFEANDSRFIVSGDEESGPFRLPGLNLGEVTPGELRKIFVEFSFRAENPPGSESIGGMYQFRLEPNREDSLGYGRRADFGTLIATSRWRTFRRPISSANNLEWFLTSLNEDEPDSFHLIWAQYGSIQSYAPGTSLLIDDLRVVAE